MTLLHLLIALSFVQPTVGILAAARMAGPRSWVEYGVAVPAGLILGMVFAWILYSAGRFVVMRYAGQPNEAPEWPFRLLYLFAALWVIAGFLLGMWLANVIFRYV